MKNLANFSRNGSDSLLGTQTHSSTRTLSGTGRLTCFRRENSIPFRAHETLPELRWVLFTILFAFILGGCSKKDDTKKPDDVSVLSSNVVVYPDPIEKNSNNQESEQELDSELDQELEHEIEKEIEKENEEVKVLPNLEPPSEEENRPIEEHKIRLIEKISEVPPMEPVIIENIIHKDRTVSVEIAGTNTHETQIKLTDIESKPVIRFATSKALVQIFSRVFEIQDPEKFFSTSEKKWFGDLNFGSSIPSEINVHQPEMITLNYLRILREKLGILCSNLINLEIENPQNTNKLVKRAGIPDLGDISEFMQTLLSDQTSVAFIKGYYEVFKDQMKNITDTNSDLYKDTLKRQYTLICIALGQDPRVYTY